MTPTELVHEIGRLEKRIKELEEIAKEVLWWDTCPDEMKEKIKSLIID